MSDDNSKITFAGITIYVAMAVGLLCLGTCGLLSSYLSPTLGEKSITWLIQLAGMASGAFLGFLSSPKVPTEQVAFLTVARAISAFLSGYALSKVDHLIDTLFELPIYKDSQLVARLLIFIIAMIISFMIAYSYRAYLQKTPKHDAEEGHVKDSGGRSSKRYFDTAMSRPKSRSTG
jgi:MFS family permease